jgi:hypothetical protein
MAGIYLDDEELDALEGAGGVAVQAYLTIRRRTDRRTWRAGVVTALSWEMLCEHAEHYIRRGKGLQTVRPHRESMRRAVGELVRRGLVQSVGNGEVLVFLCAIAKRAHLRSIETRQGNDRVYQQRGGYAESVAKSLKEHEIFVSFGGDVAAAEAAVSATNPTNIKPQEVLLPQSSSIAGCDVAPGDAQAARGVNRDRATPSQAGQLTQPGKNAVYRDRPTASHAIPGGAGLGGVVDRRAAPSAGMGRGVEKACSAAGEALIGEPGHLQAVADALRAEVLARSVRVPDGSAALAGWARLGVDVRLMRLALDRAFSAREKAGSLQPVNLGYLATCVATELAMVEEGRKVLAVGPGKRMTAEGREARVAALAGSLGLSARPGESTSQWHARVAAAAGVGHGLG